MADKLELVMQILLEDEKARNGIRKIYRETDKLEKKTNEVGDNFTFISNTVEKAQKPFKRLAAEAVAAATAIAATLLGAESTRAAARQESAVLGLANAMRIMGGFSQDALKNMQEWAAEIENTTTVSDELVLENLKLAKSFGVTNKQAKDIVRGAINLSSALGRTLDFGVINLAKSLSGLSGELGEAVPAIRDMSSEARKSGAAINYAKDQLQGFAEAELGTFTGQMKSIGNAFGSLTEAFGRGLVAAPAFRVLTKAIRDGIQDLADFVNSGEGNFMNDLVIQITRGTLTAITGIEDFVETSLSLIVKAKEFILKVIEQNREGIIEIIKASLKTFLASQNLLLGLASPLVDSFVDAMVDTLTNSTKRDVASEEVANIFQKGIDQAKELLSNLDRVEVKGFDKVKSKLESLLRDMINAKPVIEGFKDDLSSDGETVIAKASKDLKKFNENMKNLVAPTIASLGRGFEGARSMGASLAGVVGELLAPGMGSAFKELFALLSMEADQLNAKVREFFRSIPKILSNIIENLPNILVAAAEGITEAFIQVIERADIIVEKLVVGIIRALPRIAVALARAMVVVPLEMVRHMPKVATTFVGSLVREAPRFIQALVDEVKNAFNFGSGGGGSQIIKNTGGFVEDVFETITSGFGLFAEGGRAMKVNGPNIGKDIVPAKLMPGELVIDRGLTERLDQFLNEGGGGGTQVVRSELKLNNRAFGEIILELNRNNARLA